MGGLSLFILGNFRVSQMIYTHQLAFSKYCILGFHGLIFNRTWLVIMSPYYTTKSKTCAHKENPFFLTRPSTHYLVLKRQNQNEHKNKSSPRKKLPINAATITANPKYTKYKLHCNIPQNKKKNQYRERKKREKNEIK